MEPPIRFKDSAEKYGFNKEDAIIFKIGEVSPLDKIYNVKYWIAKNIVTIEAKVEANKAFTIFSGFTL